MIVGTLTSQLIDNANRKKQATVALNDTLDQINLIDLFRTFHPKTAEYTFFASTHGTFPRIDYMLGHKTSLNKFKKIKTISCIFSDHNTMKLEINHKKKSGKNTNTWRNLIISVA